jgi:catechol 2,3-dioxygenase-like lactoylglutathione lyase family enzyme
MVKFHSSVLYVSDIKAAKRFYCEILSIPIAMDMGLNVILKNGLTLWQIQKDNIIVKMLGIDALKSGHKFELYFETDDMADIERRIAERQVKTLHGIHEEPWGQNTIRVYDPDGNIVEIGEELKIFLNRMIRSGMSIQSVCEKTGMSREDVERVVKDEKGR